MKKKVLGKYLVSPLITCGFILNSFVLANGDSAPNTSRIDNLLGKIITYLLYAAVIISLFKIIQIGVMFVIQPAYKAKAKESLFPWVVGVAVSALALTVGPGIIQFFSDTFGNKGPFDVSL